MLLSSYVLSILFYSFIHSALPQRDERTLIIWSSTLDTIVPLCQDIEDRLIKLLWRTRANPLPSSGVSTTPGSANASAAPSVDHSSADHGPSAAYVGGRNSKFPGIGTGPASLPHPFPPFLTERGGTPTGSAYGFASPTPSRPASLRIINGVVKGPYGEQGREYEDEDEQPLTPGAVGLPGTFNEKGPHASNAKTKNAGVEVDEEGRRYKNTWYGRKVYLPPLSPAPQPPPPGSPSHFFGTVSTNLVDPEANKPLKRPVRLYAPLYNGLAAGLAVFFVGNGVKTLLVEWKLDDTLGSGGVGGGGWARFGLIGVVPFLWCVSLVSRCSLFFFLGEDIDCIFLG